MVSEYFFVRLLASIQLIIKYCLLVLQYGHI